MRPNIDLKAKHSGKHFAFRLLLLNRESIERYTTVTSKVGATPKMSSDSEDNTNSLIPALIHINFLELIALVAIYPSNHLDTMVFMTAIFSSERKKIYLSMNNGDSCDYLSVGKKAFTLAYEITSQRLAYQDFLSLYPKKLASKTLQGNNR